MRRLIFLIIAISTMPAMAQNGPLEADRPDQTETPSIVPVKHFQFETGFVFENDHNHAFNEQNVLYPSVLAKYGFSKRLELRLIVENASTVNREATVKTSVRGITPIRIGFKVNLCEEKGLLPKTSLIAHIALPKAASKEQRAEIIGGNFRFTMQHSLSEKLSLGYNLGASWDGISGKPTAEYTVTTGFKLSEKWGLYTELFGFIPTKDHGNHSFDGGITFLPKNNLLVDISAGFGINRYAADYFIGCGFSVRLPD